MTLRAFAFAFALAFPLVARGAVADTVENLVIDDTNGFRASEGLKPVERSAELQSAAGSFADYMAKSGRYGHQADGSTPAARVKRHGYDYCIVGENIAYMRDPRGFTTAYLASKLYEGWKHSPEHRKNMLDADVTDTAVAVAPGERNGEWYAVQLFARPRSRAIRFQVRNASSASTRYRVGEETFTIPPRGIRTHMQCREEALVVEGSGARATTHDGERLVVVNERGGLALRRE